MPDEGAVAVAEAPVVESTETFQDEPSQSTEQQKPEEKQDGRRQPDAVRKQIADFRRQADAEPDPARKQALLDVAKQLNNKVGKVGAYEEVYPTVREAREVKALLDSVGGREGFIQAQQTLQSVAEIDAALERGDPSVIERMFKEAPEGMQKLAPQIFAKLEQTNPQEYQKAVTPHAIKLLDNSGFSETFDQMWQAFKSGNAKEGDRLAAIMAKWVSEQRQTTTQQPKDPEVERLRQQLEEKNKGETAQNIERVYSEVSTHAGPVIDKYLKPIVARLGLSAEQYSALRQDTWNYLQETRNADPTYKTLAQSKYRQGTQAAAEYIKGETESRAQEASRVRANFWYGHQLKNGAKTTPNPTAQPTTPGVTRGKEPLPSEIDYSGKGIAAAKKAGFKDLGDMILAGQAPLKSGGIRKWR